MRHESALYDLWIASARCGRSLIALGNERLVVISPGVRNLGVGPDFLNAVLLVNGVVTVGSVEMHLRESDWFAHRHQDDRTYDNVILHLLAEAPATPQLSFPTVVAGQLHDHSSEDFATRANIPEREISTELLSELAWTRLLRRATEIIRSDTDLPTGVRIRRAFLSRLFDALGYSSNREPMRRLVDRLLPLDAEVIGRSFEQTAALIFSLSGFASAPLRDLGGKFMAENRLETIFAVDGLDLDEGEWRRDTRPSNSPERRLWGAAKLTFDLYSGRLLRTLFDALPQPATDPFSARPVTTAESLALKSLIVRLAGETFVGERRAMEIYLNAFLPVALAGAILSGRIDLIERISLAYREAPSMASNRILRDVERRYLAGRTIQGAFWQQGAIELFQRYLSSDRSALSFVCESRESISYVTGQKGRHLQTLA